MKNGYQLILTSQLEDLENDSVVCSLATRFQHASSMLSFVKEVSKVVEVYLGVNRSTEGRIEDSLVLSDPSGYGSKASEHPDPPKQID